MKFITLFSEDTILSSRLSMTAQFDAVEATRPYLEELKKKGVVVDYGFYGAGHALYTIWNVKTHGELHEMIELTPVRPFCSITNNAIIDGGEFGDTFGRVRKQVLSNWEKLSKDGSASKINQY